MRQCNESLKGILGPSGRSQAARRKGGSNSSCPSLGISISTSCDSSNSAEESIVEDAYRVEGGMVAKMQEGQVQLLLDECGVHLNLDSAGKRVEEGERKRG